MAERKVKNENFIQIQGWMINELDLKGNELIIYACICGFSQNGETRFVGSRQYLAEWTNSTKQGVTKCLKSLTEKGLISKEDKYINGVKFCEYWATKFTTGGQQSLPQVGNKVYRGGQQSLPQVGNKVYRGGQQSLPNNIDINNKDNIDKNNSIYTLVVSYMNEKTGLNYKPSSKKTQSLIHAREAEGFTLEDFQTVIDKKVSEWTGTEWEKYLRPETLFGTKFESYLNAKGKGSGNNGMGHGNRMAERGESYSGSGREYNLSGTVL